MLEKLTPEQEALIPVYLEKWEKICLSTEPADRDRAEKAVCQLYKELGFVKPEKFLWRESALTPYEKCLSDLAGEKSFSLSQKIKRSVWESIVTKGIYWINNDARKAVKTLLSDSIEDALFLSTNVSQKQSSVWYVYTHVLYRHRNGVGQLGQLDASWLWRYDFLDQVCGLDFQALHSIMELTKSCGLWYLMDQTVVFTERPKGLHFDENGRFYSPNGYAWDSRDGSGLYFWHNVDVPENVILHPELIKVQDIEEEGNQERRRVMIERYGLDRFVEDSGAVETDSDEFGVLYTKSYEEPFGQQFKVVKVKNSTPEPDGSYKYYFLPVPPHIKTPREGVAWSFGYDNSEDYCPDIET